MIALVEQFGVIVVIIALSKKVRIFLHFFHFIYFFALSFLTVQGHKYMRINDLILFEVVLNWTPLSFLYEKLKRSTFFCVAKCFINSLLSLYLLCEDIYIFSSCYLFKFIFIHFFPHLYLLPRKIHTTQYIVQPQ